MPASRSRTTEWRRSLEQLRERGGAIEIAVAHDDVDVPVSGGPGSIADLVWRVRVLDVGANDFAVDLPFALGCPVEMPNGTDLIGAIAIGQNRWMFRTSVQGAWTPNGPFPKNHRGIRLSLPRRSSAACAASRASASPKSACPRSNCGRCSTRSR